MIVAWHQGLSHSFWTCTATVWQKIERHISEKRFSCSIAYDLTQSLRKAGICAMACTVLPHAMHCHIPRASNPRVSISTQLMGAQAACLVSTSVNVSQGPL
jgi:hypothetical protein